MTFIVPRSEGTPRHETLERPKRETTHWTLV
jgi:hypothetical protein